MTISTLKTGTKFRYRSTPEIENRLKQKEEKIPGANCGEAASALGENKRKVDRRLHALVQGLDEKVRPEPLQTI